MRRFSKRSALIVAGAAAVAVAGGGVAFAFWTGGGAGSGGATSGTTLDDIAVVQTSTVTAMAPGVAAQTLSGNFTNTNDGPVYVTAVTASIASVTKAVGAPVGPCTAADYTLTGATMPVGTQVAAGSAQGSWSGATIAFANDPAANQDGCKGATVTIAYTMS